MIIVPAPWLNTRNISQVSFVYKHNRTAEKWQGSALFSEPAEPAGAGSAHSGSDPAGGSEGGRRPSFHPAPSPPPATCRSSRWPPSSLAEERAPQRLEEGRALCLPQDHLAFPSARAGSQAAGGPRPYLTYKTDWPFNRHVGSQPGRGAGPRPLPVGLVRSNSYFMVRQ